MTNGIFAIKIKVAVLPFLVLAQTIEKEIATGLTPSGSLIPQAFPWSTILLAVGICAAVFFFFLTILPRLAVGIYQAGGLATILIAVTLALLIPFSVRALRSPTKTLIEASPGTIPQNVSVTETTTNSFTVEWTTSAEAVGMVKYGPAPDDLLFFALDEKGNLLTTTHRIKVENLKPKTRYYFEVVSGQIRFNDNGKPLEIVTL